VAPRLYLTLSGLLVALIVFVPSVKACSLIGVSERLQAGCIVKKFNDQTATQQDFASIVSLSKKIGISLGGGETYPKYWYRYDLSPYLAYDHNFNGGNPDKPLIINGYEFVGDERLLRQSATSAGVWGGIDTRLFWSPERFLELKVSGTKEYALGSGSTKSTSSASICSNNHIHAGLYADLCKRYDISRKQLSDSKYQTTEASIEYVVPLSGQNLASIRFSKQNISTEGDSYTVLKIKPTLMVSPSAAAWIEGGWSSGGNLDDRLTLSDSFSFGLSGLINHRRASVSLSKSRNDGLAFFGTDVKQTITSLELRTDFVGASHLVLGAASIASNLTYYEDQVYSLRVESGF